MPINYKDINELTEQTTIAGTEKVPVSGTKYVLFNKIKDWTINSLKTTGLDLGGKQIKNAAIDVVTSLPTTNRFVGRRVTYQGRSYIWDGSAWKCDAKTLDGKQLSDLVQYIVDSPLTHKYIQFDTVTSFGWKNGAGLIIALYQDSGTNSFGDYHSYDCMELFGCNYSTPNKVDIFEGGVYPNPTDNAKIAKRNIWTDSPDVIKYKHKLTEGIFGSLGNAPPNTNLTAWLNASYNGISGHALKNSSSFFTDLSAAMTYSLNLTQLNPNLKMGMNYTFVGRAVSRQAILELTDTRDTAIINALENQIISFDFVKVANGVIIYRNLEVR